RVDAVLLPREDDPHGAASQDALDGEAGDRLPRPERRRRGRRRRLLFRWLRGAPVPEERRLALQDRARIAERERRGNVDGRRDDALAAGAPGAGVEAVAAPRTPAVHARKVEHGGAFLLASRAGWGTRVRFF